MPPLSFTPNDKLVLKALCLQPWANDRELAEAFKINQSTVTSCKNRMRRNGICRKAFLPAYNHLGYPLVSFSQLRTGRPPGELLTALGMYQDINIGEANKTLLSFMASDPFNSFVMAHHRDYTAFKKFEKAFGQDTGWSHEVCAMDGATKVVNFDHINIVNKMFFPGEFMASAIETQDVAPFEFSRTEAKVFDGFLAYQEGIFYKIASKTGVTRQSVVKILGRFKKAGVLEKGYVIDLGRLGLQILSVITFKMDRPSSKDLANINRMLAPFYYWVFDNIHVLIIANIDFKGTMGGLGQLNKVKGVSDLRIQHIQLGTE